MFVYENELNDHIKQGLPGGEQNRPMQSVGVKMFAVTQTTATKLDETTLRELDKWSLIDRQKQLKKFCAARLGAALEILGVRTTKTPNCPTGVPSEMEHVVRDWLTGCTDAVIQRYPQHEDKQKVHSAIIRAIDQATRSIKEKGPPKRPPGKTATMKWDQHRELMSAKEQELNETKEKLTQLQKQYRKTDQPTGSPDSRNTPDPYTPGPTTTGRLDRRNGQPPRHYTYVPTPLTVLRRLKTHRAPRHHDRHATSAPQSMLNWSDPATYGPSGSPPGPVDATCRFSSSTPLGSLETEDVEIGQSAAYEITRD
jgi:hypothetical protein